MPQKTTYTHWSDDQIQEMKALYENGMTLTEVGEKFDISKQRVEQIFKKAGIQIRSRKMSFKFRNTPRKRKILEKDLLVKWYLDERMSLREMEKQLKIGFTIIRNSLVHHGIRIRPANEYISAPLTRELLEPLYLQEKMTADEIAGQLGYQPVTIKKKLSELGIKKDISLRRYGKRKETAARPEKL